MAPLWSYLVLGCVFLVDADLKSYEGYTVWRIVPHNDQQLSLLIQLQDVTEYDFWREPTEHGIPVDIMVPPGNQDYFTLMLEASGLERSVMVENVQTLIDANANKHRKRTGWTFEDYNQLNEIYDGMATLASQSNDVSVEEVGSTYEDRSINALRISRPGNNRPAIWIDCGIHAREWISPAVCQYIITRLIEDYDVSPDVRRVRDAFDWYIEPVVNPDGYQYTWTDERMWRKTRKPNVGSTCVGTDGNRNFPVGWGGVGSSDNPCSQTYRGTGPMSEIEIANLDFYVRGLNKDIRLALTIHSYGQFFVYPWGFTTATDPDNIADLDRVAQDAVREIVNTNGKSYTGRRSNGDMAGNTIDWAMQDAGATYAYLFEVRDTGEHGFLLPPEQIRPTCEEIWAGVLRMAVEVIQ